MGRIKKETEIGLKGLLTTAIDHGGVGQGVLFTLW